MTLPLLVLVASLCLQITTQESSPAEACRARIAEGKRLAHEAVSAADARPLAAARDAFAAAVAADASSAPALYHLAWVESTQAVNTLTEPKVQAQALKDAAKHCEAAVEKDPHSADAKALLASIYGIQISKNFMLGATLGQKSTDLVEEAVKLAPENPRVWIAHGAAKLHTPPMFGGDPEVAVKDFEKSVQLAEKERHDDPLAPEWGRVESLAWLGRALEKVGRDDDAKKAYERALALEPEYGWVKRVLLPALEKRMDKQEE